MKLEDNGSKDKDLKNNASEKVSDVSASFVDDTFNVKGKAAEMLKNRS